MKHVSESALNVGVSDDGGCRCYRLGDYRDKDKKRDFARAIRRLSEQQQRSLDKTYGRIPLAARSCGRGSGISHAGTI